VKLARIAAAATAVAVIAGGGAAALAASSSGSTTTNTIAGCVKTSGSPTRLLFDVYTTTTPTCPKGSFAVSWNRQGPAGPAGPQGPQGPPGPAGTPYTVQAVFTLTGRDDSGNGSGKCTASANDYCWATDDITRTVSVTRHGAVQASDCGGSATQCWFYTATLSDTGTFTTISGAQTPNQACTEPNDTSCAGLVINGTLSGTLTGGGMYEFYADSPTPTVPLTTAYSGDGPSGVDTSHWYELFFPSSTNFGITSTAGAPLITWSWTYNAPNTCESWTDAYNNGDGNGSFSSDGNIAGINLCTN
jgi:hypothetical protein